MTVPPADERSRETSRSLTLNHHQSCEFARARSNSAHAISLRVEGHIRHTEHLLAQITAMIRRVDAFLQP